MRYKTPKEAREAKRKLDFRFTKIGEFNIDELKSKIQSLDPNDWTIHTYRNSSFRTHKMTNTLELLWDPSSIETGNVGNKNLHNYKSLEFDEVEKLLKEFYRNVYGEGKFIRILIVRLNPKGSIASHCDSGISLMEVHRTHIPIITNPKVTFTVKDTTLNLKEGEVWEINNSKLHSVDNNSEEGRIHMIIDYLPDSKT
jgi:quercetin dioxygenase-like cupin family protein